MQLLPDLENNRPLAIGLLVIVLALVYLLGFHWFVMRHVAMANEVDRLEQSAARFKAAVARRPDLAAQLEDLQVERLDSALFLPESNANVAAAGLTRRLRDIIEREADDADLCSISSTNNRPDSEPERFEQVTVNVRMSCPLPDLSRILYQMENSVPLIFVDNLIMNQPVSADRASGRRSRSGYGQIDAIFNMYGFLPQQVED